jgi:antitoxin component of MazEF toxin-antitoxin module
MIKTIKKIGNSRGIILDSALLDLARLREGDQLDLVVHESGAITLTPIRPMITPEEGSEKARALIGRNNELFRRLSK